MKESVFYSNTPADDFEKLNQAKFESVIGYSFDFEGGYVNNKNDRGGETKFGITSPLVNEMILYYFQ
ncbi:MAG: hypothetical protein J6U58_05390 [Bacteroidaceae bacterium]|nr:hypothetical protein [Bacteroidaceae bacterium]